MAQRIETMVFSLWSNPESNRGNGHELSRLVANGWRITNRGETVASQSGLSAPSTTQTIELQRVVEVADDTPAGPARPGRSSPARVAAAVAASGSAGAGPAAGIAAGFDLALFGRHLAAAVAGAGVGAGGGSGFGSCPHHQVQQQRLPTRSELRDVTLRERWQLIGAAEQARYGDLDCYLAWHAGIDAGQIIEPAGGAVSFDGRSAT